MSAKILWKQVVRKILDLTITEKKDGKEVDRRQDDEQGSSRSCHSYYSGKSLEKGTGVEVHTPGPSMIREV